MTPLNAGSCRSCLLISSEFDGIVRKALITEDFAQVIGSFHKICESAVAQFEGSVAKYLGDGVLAYFGYPEAHEDDAERAIRAGLSLIEYHVRG